MAHSLEARVPYLDHEIVEYVERLSARFKVRKCNMKWLHRQVCRDFMPVEIIRRKKRGFGVTVVDDWFRSSLTGKINGILIDNDSLMYNYLNHKVVQKLVNEHISGKNDNHKTLFSLVIFEEWLRSTEL